MVFTVENPKESIETLQYDKVKEQLDALDLRLSQKRVIINQAAQLCKKYSVRNELHILGYGNKIPDTLGPNCRYIAIAVSKQQ